MDHGKEKESASSQEREIPICRSKIWEELHHLAERGIFVEPKPKEKWTFVDQKREETMHRTEWCAEADRHRCMKRGGGSKYMEM